MNSDPQARLFGFSEVYHQKHESLGCYKKTLKHLMLLKFFTGSQKVRAITLLWKLRMGLSKIGVPPRLVSFELGSFSTSIMMVEEVFETKNQESLVSGGFSFHLKKLCHCRCSLLYYLEFDPRLTS